MRRVNGRGTRGRPGGWLIDVAAGSMIGGILGGIVAVNLVIYLGVEGGYQASIGDVFGHSVLLGLAVVAVLVSGPVAGVVVARRQRRKRALEVRDLEKREQAASR